MVQVPIFVPLDDKGIKKCYLQSPMGVSEDSYILSILACEFGSLRSVCLRKTYKLQNAQNIKMAQSAFTSQSGSKNMLYFDLISLHNIT